MLNNLLGFIAGSDGNYYFENFGEALVYALIGFLIVFAGIVIIILIIFVTAFSLPGIGLELKTIRSFGFMDTFLCIPLAIRDNAAIDSP